MTSNNYTATLRYTSPHFTHSNIKKF